MKVISRKGVTIASLVITVIVLAIITGVIVSTTIGDDGIVEEVQNNISEQERKALIQTIAKEIQAKQLKKEISGTYTFNVVEDVIPILENYGTYDNQTLKLTTEDGKEIYLYDMMQIPMLEYATVTYEDEVLTIQTTLTGYTVEYTTNGGQSWNAYTEAVDVSEGSSLFARIKNSEGKVISNTIKIVEGTMQTEDTTPPIIRIVSQTNQGKTIDVTIYVVEYGKLANNNEYQYYLSTSNETQENGEWKQYTPGKTFTIGEDLEGTYYIHVKGVSDISGNTSDIQVSGAYVIEGDIPPVVRLTVNGNSSPQKSQSTTIEIETDKTDKTVMYSYAWSESNTVAPTDWTMSISKTQTTTKDTVTGNYYLWIKDLQDTEGIKAETIEVGGIEVNLVSEAFFIDNQAPNEFTPQITSITDKTITLTGNTTDNNGQVVTYYYSSDNGQTWLPTNGTTSTSYTFTNLTSGEEYNLVMKAVDIVNNEGETDVLKTNTYVQQKNYLMLYDRGDECVDVTGGWELYGSNAGTFSKNADSLSISYIGTSVHVNFPDEAPQFISCGTRESFDASDYKHFYVCHRETEAVYLESYGYSWTWSEAGLRTDKSNYYIGRNGDGTFSPYLNNRLRLGFSDYTVSLYEPAWSRGTYSSGGLVYAGLGFTKNYSTEISGTTYLYDFFAVKLDNWQEWCEIGGVDASIYADETELFEDIDSIQTLLNNKMAVEYMIYNCTGTVMGNCMYSSDILTMVKNSQYKDLITSNIHWNKFIQKFSS